MLIIVPNAAVDLLVDALTVMMFWVLPDIGVDVLANVNLNMFAVLMTSFEFAMPGPLEEFRC